MYLKCRHQIIVPGRGVVSKGEEIDWQGTIPPHFYNNFFTDKDGKCVLKKDALETGEAPAEVKAEDLFEAKATETDRLVANTAKLSKEKLIAKLDEHGIVYNPSMTNRELALAYHRHIGQA